MFIASVPVMAAIALTSLNHDLLQGTVDLSLPELNAVGQPPNSGGVSQDIPDYEYVIQSGDSLSAIFDKLGFSYRDMMHIMETDVDYLKLDTLMPGDTLRFWRSENHKLLQKMELQFSLADRATYTRLKDGSYTFKDITLPGKWKEYPLVGQVQGSFSQSLQALGVSSRESEQVVGILKDKLNFARDLRAGDKFELVESRQFIDGKPTGNKEIQAIKIFNQGNVVTAYLYKDGQYYDKFGNSLQRAFQRHPFSGHYRISSSFNPFRRHPVTGRIMPHNGTDWAVPVGTPIVATGDGVVIMTRHHPYAGNYVVIRHGSNYTTRYLHLSKILVKRGQKVTRGQEIALSGKTGRVTGPHIHYELIVKGHPVNAVTAKIPMAHSVARQDMPDFIAQRDRLDELLHQQEVRVAGQAQSQPTS
ncbi:peptidoglycan DD-metalloendopeptidase family protein [Vibrio profundum]|uniref:peptidoglycan DD-metalloendopeptidase family protein n=1 Tax=Vibrio profundum TaxID=2910247 RepID=UPI003D14DCFC